MKSHDIYLAAPLFNDAERAFNEALVDEIERVGLTVFLPQRDGLEFAALERVPQTRRSKKIFDLDVATLETASVVVAVLDGRVPDEGVCVEIGIGREYARLAKDQKWILGLKTDLRTWLPGGSLNPMIEAALDELFDSQAALIEFLKSTIIPITNMPRSVVLSKTRRSPQRATKRGL